MESDAQTGLNIGIVGAGIAGLATALALLKDGHQVSLFEKNAALAELGAGIQLSPNATRILSEWDLLKTIKELAVAPNGIRFLHWQSGKTLADFPLNHKPEEFPYLHVHRSDLYQCLLEALAAYSKFNLHIGETLVEVIGGKTCCDIKTQTVSGEIKTHRFDYLIGADGIHSLCREYIQNNSPANFTGNIAWRGLIARDKLPEKFENKAHLVMAPGAHLVFYYIKDEQYLNYVAVKEGSLFKQESWTEQGELQDLLKDFSNWHESYLNILKQSDSDKIFRWALYDREPLAAWHKDRCIIIGDAAHPLLPYLSQGAAMGIEDAQALAKCFKENNIDSIGEEFFEKRKQRCEQVFIASRDNMKLYHEKNKIKRVVRDLGAQVFSKIYPEFLNNKLTWLYRYKI